MDKDEKLLRALDLLQQRAKMFSDAGIKGIILHLGITAFSMNAAFRDTVVSLWVIQISNTVFTGLALLALLLAGQDFTRLRREMLAIQHQLDMGFDEKDFSGFPWMHRVYCIGCVILIGFWLSLSWTPWRP